MKRSAEYYTTEGTEEEKVGKSVVERCISTPIPNHLSTLTFTSNAQSSIDLKNQPHSQLHTLIICLPINFTTFATRFLVSMTVREGWKRGKKRG